jgi:Reverse transcriptase (RNA-dependent DNA polymerase)
VHNMTSCQYGSRKSRGTRDCLALLTTDVQISFERKQPTVAAFIDISKAYDNVLIDILCDILREKEVPLQVVRFFSVYCGGRYWFSLLAAGSV